MKGHIDEAQRALLEVDVRSTPSALPTPVTVWIDTASNGFLVFPRRLIDQLGLEQEAATDAILADGSRVTLESYVCFIEWFGAIIAAQVVANEGKVHLLGVDATETVTTNGTIRGFAFVSFVRFAVPIQFNQMRKWPRAIVPRVGRSASASVGRQNAVT